MQIRWVIAIIVNDSIFPFRLIFNLNGLISIFIVGKGTPDRSSIGMFGFKKYEERRGEEKREERNRKKR